MILLLLGFIVLFLLLCYQKEYFGMRLHKKTLPSRYSQRVPFLIMATHEIMGCQANLQALIRLNPEYHVYFFDQAARRIWLHEYFPAEVLQAYDEIIPGAYQADLFRYCFLFKKGGIYLDINKKLIAPLRTFIHPRATMGLVLNSNHTDKESPKIVNGFLYIIQGHSLMKRMIDQCVQNIQKKVYGASPLSVTGPYVFGTVFEEMMGKSLYHLGTGIHYLHHEIVHVMLYKEKVMIGDPATQTDIVSFASSRQCLSASMPPERPYPIYWKNRNIYRL